MGMNIHVAFPDVQTRPLKTNRRHRDASVPSKPLYTLMSNLFADEPHYLDRIIPGFLTRSTSCNLTQSPGFCRIYLRMMEFVRSHASSTKHSQTVELIQLSRLVFFFFFFSGNSILSLGDSVPASFFFLLSYKQSKYVFYSRPGPAWIHPRHHSPL